MLTERIEINEMEINEAYADLLRKDETYERQEKKI